VAVYFAIFNRQRAQAHSPATNTKEEVKFENVKILPSQGTEPIGRGGLEAAKVVRLEANSIAEAQMGVRHFYGGTADTPVIVTEAQFKEA
jgi:hypothetical protein